jgi:hypothetical protein
MIMTAFGWHRHFDHVLSPAEIVAQVKRLEHRYWLWFAVAALTTVAGVGQDMFDVELGW